MTAIKDAIKRLFITIAISTIICISVTILFMNDTITIEFILKSILLGSLIWLVSEFAFELVEKIWPHKVLPGYVVLFIIILMGTAFGLIIFGIKSFVIITIICAVAEISGLSIAIISRWQYKKRLNEQLDRFKKEN